jgi:hypothetical protein
MAKAALRFSETQMELVHSHSLVSGDHNREATLFREDRSKEI